MAKLSVDQPNLEAEDLQNRDCPESRPRLETSLGFELAEIDILISEEQYAGKAGRPARR